VITWKLFDRIHPVRNSTQTGGIIVRRQPIDDEAVGQVALAVDGNALAGDRGGLGEQLVAADVGWRNAWNEEREVEEVAPVHRHTLNLGQHYRSDGLAPRCFEQGWVARYDDCGVDPRQFEREGDVERGSDRQRQRRGALGESVEVGFQLVPSDSEVWNRYPPSESVTVSAVTFVC
jgi:hypothetical protein